MNRYLVPVLAALLSLAVAGSVWAGPRQAPGKAKIGPKATCSSLGPQSFSQIPAEKRQEVQGLIQQHRQEAFVLRQELRAKRAELWALVADPKGQQQGIDRATKAVNSAQAKLLKQRVKFSRELYAASGQLILPHAGQMHQPGSGHGPGHGKR